VALLEISSPVQLKTGGVSAFDLLGSAGTAKLKRVIKAEVFDDPYVSGKPYAYYEYGGAHPWDGVLPAGLIRLRVGVEFADNGQKFSFGGRCRITVGPYVLKGPANGPWPT
jgi:hypothetical protein